MARVRTDADARATSANTGCDASGTLRDTRSGDHGSTARTTRAFAPAAPSAASRHAAYSSSDTAAISRI